MCDLYISLLFVIYYQEGVGTYLRHVQIPLIPPDKCTVKLNKDSQICAGVLEGGRDACQVCQFKFNQI